MQGVRHHEMSRDAGGTPRNHPGGHKKSLSVFKEAREPPLHRRMI